MARGGAAYALPASGSGTGLTDTQAAATTVTNGSTITYSGTNVVRLTAASIVTGLIVTAGTVPAYPLLLINTGSNSLIMAAQGTSHVANGAACVIKPNSLVYLYWDTITSLWYPAEDFPYDAKSSAATVASSGTIAWVGDVFRVTSTGPVTGVIINPGKWDGQHLVLINTGNNPITMAASGTSNVSDGIQCMVPPLRALNLYWDALNALWLSDNPNQFNYSGWGQPILMGRML